MKKILAANLRQLTRIRGNSVMVNNSLNRKEREERKEFKRKTLRPLR
jgi:hypothetical protein